MSSKPNQPEKAAAPPPEKKKPSGPVITPQVLAIILGIILVIALIVYYQSVVVKFSNEKDQLNSQIAQTRQNIQTYERKGAKLEEAREVSKAIREKLSRLDYLFLQDQSSVLPFFENVIFPMIESSRMDPGVIELEEYTFYINTAMTPFKTLPSTIYFEGAEDLFPVVYIGEKDGQPVEGPVDTTPNQFLTPFTLTFEEFRGTYEDAKEFVRRIQTSQQDPLITVHCLKNDDGENVGIYRTNTSWTFVVTAYFMNPEKSASGDKPPGLPEDESC